MNTLKIERKGDYVIVELNNGKVNAINAELTKDLHTAFSELEQDETVKGAILAGRPGCFSAGMDVQAMATADLEGTKDLWRSYMIALRTMVHFSKPLVCAMTGYAPAGATILTLCADYRIMAKGAKHRVGMHEFKMSMVIPRMLANMYAYQLGETVAWEAVQNARLYTSDEAVTIGLVHESVEEAEVLPRAEQQLKKMLNVYLPTYQASKAMFRKGLHAIVDQDIDALTEEVAKSWDDPFTRQTMQLFLASLKR